MRSAPDEEHDEPLDDDREARASSGGKISGSRFREDVPVWSAAKRSAARPMPTAVLRPSSATAMPMKPIVEPWIWVDVEPELPAEDVERAGEPGEAPGDRHRQEVVAGDADPAVARRLRVETDSADLVPERRPVQRERVDDERDERHEEADVEPLEQRVAPEDGRASRSSAIVLGRGNRVGLARVWKRAVDAEEVASRPR